MSLVEVTTPSGKKKTIGIAQDQSGSVLTIVVLGATGDLAKKVPMLNSAAVLCGCFLIRLSQLTFPALFALYTSKLMPEKFHVVGVGRQPASGKPALTAAGLRDHLCSNAGTSKAAGKFSATLVSRHDMMTSLQYLVLARTSSLLSAALMLSQIIWTELSPIAGVPSCMQITTVQRTLPLCPGTARS